MADTIMWSRSKQVNTNLVIKLNGGSTEGTNMFTYNGSRTKTINVTASSIGAATTSQIKTYAAGTGLSLSGTTFNHKVSVTAATRGPSANATVSPGSAITVPSIAYDAQGHVTSSANRTITLNSNILDTGDIITSLSNKDASSNTKVLSSNCVYNLFSRSLSGNPYSRNSFIDFTYFKPSSDSTKIEDNIQSATDWIQNQSTDRYGLLSGYGFFPDAPCKEGIYMSVTQMLQNKQDSGKTYPAYVIYVGGNSTNDASLHIGTLSNDGNLYLYEMAQKKYVDDKINGYKLLWSGNYYPTSSQRCNLSEKVSAQKNGIVLWFSLYNPGQSSDKTGWFPYYVHKSLFDVKGTTGKGSGCIVPMVASGNFSKVGYKYIYIADTYVVGHDVNDDEGTGSSINYDNGSYSLRYIYGW